MDNAGDRLQKYRESISIVTKECPQCKESFETRFGTFCSTLCKSKHHKEQKRLEKLKDLVCHFCGGPITEKRKTKFCCENHKNDFFEAKRSEKKIALKINAKTTIFTNKYDKIPEILANYRTMSEDMTNGPGGGGFSSAIKVGSNYISGDMW